MRAIELYWVFSCLLTALFVQQSNAGSVLTWQPQIEWFVDYYHSEWNNLISGHWTRSVGECRTLAGQRQPQGHISQTKAVKQGIVDTCIFSPKGEQDQGCIFFSAPPPSQHRLCCTWYQWKWQVIFLSVRVQPLTYPDLNQILSWQTQLRRCMWRQKDSQYLRTIGSPMVPWGHFSTFLEGLLIHPSCRICATRQMQNSSTASLQVHSLGFKPCQKMQFIGPSSTNS